MEVRNAHARRLTATPEGVGALLDSLASDTDARKSRQR